MSETTATIPMVSRQKLNDLELAFGFCAPGSNLGFEGHSGPIRQKELTDIFSLGGRGQQLTECFALASSIVAATIVSSQAACSDELTKYADVSPRHMLVKPQESPKEQLATFYGPVTFEWDEDELEIIEAVERFCESAYANS